MSQWSNFGFGALGSFADSFLGGLGNALFGGISSKRQWNYQRKQLALQQQYNLDNMATQFDYQRQAWEAQNAYNDPVAVRQRFERAGISPQAMLGGSATGAGIATSMETPSSQGPSGSADYSGVVPRGQAVLAGMLQMKQMELADADIQKKDAEARKANAEAQKTENYNSAWNLVRDVMNSNAISARAQAQIADIVAKYQNSKSQAEIDKVLAEIDNIVASTDLKAEEKEKLRAATTLFRAQVGTEEAKQGLIEEQTKTEGAKRDQMAADTKESYSHANYLDAQSATENAIRDYKVEMAKEGVKKVSAETEESKARARQVDAEIERIGKLNNLTDEQIKASKQARARAWAEFGVNTAVAISQEARMWMTPWKKEPARPNLYGSDGRVVGQGGILTKPY